MLVTKKIARAPVFAPFTDVVDPVNRIAKLFEPFGLGLPTFGPAVGYVPPIELIEAPDELVLTCELPGMMEKDIELVVENNVLTIAGEKKATYPAGWEEEKEESWKEKADVPRYLAYERVYGAFTRSFTLPRTVDATKIRAHFEKGVLHVTLPKVAEAKGRRIAIGTN
ncbi:MAG TPA: Hsp20/alpha crystallin family protein [Gemmatimonadaceae bacterium]|nr:Hsp20/alpha crystallin family protein [Gemmatimonadaceae bacterium]